MADGIKTFKVTASPHTISKETNRSIMIDVLIALLPSFIAGIVFFGLNAVYTVAVCMLFCYASEQIFNLCLKRPPTTDLSCLVTGMILGLILPPKTPWYIPLVGSVFAIIFIKMLFGGVGKNIANPAATARVFLLLAFSTAMGSYLVPNASDFVHIDGTTAPTYLGGGYASLNGSFMGVTGYWGYILQLFFGHVGGSIGETSAIAILIGFIYLMARKVIDWRIPISYITSSALMTLICYQTAADVLPQLLSGGLLFGAVFMATDYATCPKFKHNRVLFGIFIGFMTIILRKFSNYPESVSFAIILANLFVPILDNFVLPLRFGQTTKTGKVRPNIYGISMQWIVPVFLVLILILIAVFAVVNPYVERYYGKYTNQYAVASAQIQAADGTALAEKGDYLFTVNGKVRYKDSNGKEQSTALDNYVVVLYSDTTTRATATLKVRNIIEREYPFANNAAEPKLTYKAVDANIADKFKDKTLSQVKELTTEQLTVAPTDDTVASKDKATELTQINLSLKEATIDAFEYYNFIQTQGVEQFTHEARVEVKFDGIDGTSRPTQENYFSITLQKSKNGEWTVASINNYVSNQYGYTVDVDAFIGKNLERVQDLTFDKGKTPTEKANDAMNRALQEEVIKAFQAATGTTTTKTVLQDVMAKDRLLNCREWEVQYA